MRRKEQSGVGRKLEFALTWAAVLYLLAWMFGWLIQRKLGAILIIWALWFIGAIIVLSAALTSITGNYDLGDRVWPWLVFGVVAAVMTAVQWNDYKK